MNEVKQENLSEVESSSNTSTKSSSQRKKPKRKILKAKRTRTKASTSDRNAPYSLTNFLKQSRFSSTPIYGIAFNHFIDNRNIFATASKNNISIYECAMSMKLLRVYSDSDKEEDFYCICWGYRVNYGRSAEPVIAAGGAKGILRVVFCNQHPSSNFLNLVGHTAAINDVKFHPVNPELLLSASKDNKILLWNIQNASCLANFSGIDGHRDQVLTISFSADGNRFVSGGMDNCIKIWRLDVEELQDKIDMNNNAVDNKRNETVRIHCPEFTTREIHTNYVDTVKFFGNSIISKSCQNEIVYWKHNKDAKLKNSGAQRLFTFDLMDCEMWFIRMELNLQMTQMAVGSENGKIFLFDLNTEHPMNYYSTLSHEKCVSCVRQVAFSRSGNIMVAVCDDGTIWRWDRKIKIEEA